MSKTYQKGDILVDSTGRLCAVCTGTDTLGNPTIISSSKKDGIYESKVNFKVDKVYRIKPLHDYSIQGTSSSNPYKTKGNKYPDENGKILTKSKPAINTVQAYTSENPYGDEQQRNNTSSSTTTNTSNSKTSGTVTAGNYSNGETTTSKTIYNIMHADLGTFSPVSEEELNKWINYKCSIANKNPRYAGKVTLFNTAATFLKASELSGLDPRFLFALSACETGYGSQDVITRQKHNYYNIGAVDNNPQNGAYSYKTKEEGIINGAIQIAKWYYINNKQQTMYQMRFNNGVHQYATDNGWAEKIARTMATGPKNTQIVVKTGGTSENEKRVIGTGTGGAYSGKSGENYDSSGETGGQISSTTVTIDNSEAVALKEADRRNRYNTSKDLTKSLKETKIKQGSLANYKLPDVQDDGSNYTDGSVDITETRTMTIDEFNSIAYVVASQCEGEKLNSKMAFTQMIYDRVMAPNKNFGGITMVTNEFKPNFSKKIESKDMNEAKSCVTGVFCNGMRFRKGYDIYYVTSIDDSNFANELKRKHFTKVGSCGTHIYWGLKDE